MSNHSDRYSTDILAARRAIAAGDALAAVDLLQALPAPLQTLESRQLVAMSLLRAGALKDAQRAVHALIAEGYLDEETLGLAAREAKSRYQHGDPNALREAREAYLRAFRATRGTWTGVNAATLALLDGDEAMATQLAREVDALLDMAPMAERATYWHQATVGEVALLLSDIPRALEHYPAALSLAPRAYGNHRSVRDNALAILASRGLPASILQGVFPGVGVAVFSGHMVDAPQRPTPRFPAHLESSVAASIEGAIDKHGIEIGIAGAACGGDILFLEALQRRGKETIVVLPHPADAFRKVSVTDPGGDAWGPRFDTVIKTATEVVTLAPHLGEDLAYQFQGAVMAGLSLQRARSVGGHLLGLALWDGQPGGVGGTGTVIEEWAARGIEVVRLPLGAGTVRLLAPIEARQLLGDMDLRSAGGQRVVSIIFADAVGFSRLGEFQVKAFVQEFWGRVAGIVEDVPEGRLLSANTWGDGLFLVFQDAVSAAMAALNLSAMVTRTKWEPVGLPADTNIRIAVHAGPVYEIEDPITRRRGFAGMHISRAARIEPVTPPGEVYVSEAFAGLLEFDDSRDRFSCEFVGTVPMAKEYGRFRTYRLAYR